MKAGGTFVRKAGDEVMRPILKSGERDPGLFEALSPWCVFPFALKVRTFP